MAHRLLLAALFLFTAPHLRAVVPFLYMTNTFGIATDAMAWGDFDNDGFLDLVTTGSYGSGPAGNGNTTLYRNDGKGGFVNTGIKFVGFRDGYVEWMDVDNDGYLDLVLSGMMNEDPGLGSIIYKNVGGTGFVKMASIDGNMLIDGFLDINNDGLMDFTVRNTFSTFLWENARSSPFKLYFSGFRYFQGNGRGVGDIDGDGYVDIIDSGEGGLPNFGSFLMHNDRGRGFIDYGKIGPDGEPRLFDFDNDGKVDLWLGSYVGAGTYTWRNDGGAVVSAQKTLDFTGLRNGIAVGDYDNDGLMDVISSPNLFHNEGNNQWLVVTNSGFAARDVSYNVYFGDYDNDGDLDVVMIGQTLTTGYPEVHLYQNRSRVSNSPPSQPFLLNSEPVAYGVKLKWDRATDAQQAGGLTYNVRVGTTPGGGDIVNPSAASNGWRRVVRAGNAGLNEFFILQRLEPGRRYYWSVQAVDNSYAGGPFAAEESFVAVGPPKIDPIPDFVLLEDSSATNLSIRTSSDFTPAEDLRVTVESSNTDLFQPSELILSDSGSNRVLTLKPAPNRNGTARVTVTATDALGAEGTATFNIQVKAVNDPPTFTLSTTPEIVWEDSGLQTVTDFARNMRAGPADESGQALHFVVFAEQPERFSIQPSIDPQGVLTYRPAADVNGACNVTVQLVDNGGVDLGGLNRSAPQTFTIVIVPTPDPIVPAFKVAGLVPFPGQSAPFTIARCAGEAHVWLDASATTNPDVLPLVYTWSVNGSLVATGRVSSVALTTGTNIIRLSLSGGAASQTTTQTVFVIPPQTATYELEKILVTSNLNPGDTLALLRILISAEDAYAAGQCTLAAGHLKTFVDEIFSGAYVGEGAVLSGLVLGAQQIIEASGQGPLQTDRARIISTAKAGLTVQLKVEPFPGTASLIERSLDLTKWERIGALGQFDGPVQQFEDRFEWSTTPKAAFYRIVTE